MTQITIDGLSAESLTKASDRVKKLQRAYVNKTRQFVKALCDKGISVMSDNLIGKGDSEPPEIPTKPHVFMGSKDGHMQAVLRLRGEDVMFVEFGAGIHYNSPAGTSPHPKGLELGYTIGSYGMGQGANDFWHYEDDNGIWVRSYGTEATMPMWKADMAIRNEFESIAKQVFNIRGI